MLSLSDFNVAGVDEAGRGPCAGPVVAAAVMLPQNAADFDWIGAVRDSKKLTAKKRDELFGLITAHCDCAIAECDVGEIDTINILQASLLAMKRAVEKLRNAPAMILIDGNQSIDFGIPSQTVIGGDGKYISIAAASILAKVHRDRIMQNLSVEYPHYGWDRNSGYPTKTHLDAMARHGITPHHRRTYAPVRKILENNDKVAA